MATVSSTPVLSKSGDYTIVKWGPLTTSNRDGAPVTLPGQTLVSVQLTGTLGAGSPSIAAEGTLDPGGSPVYAGLSDVAGSVIAMTALGIKEARGHAHAYRPNLTGGDGSTSLTATFMFVKNGKE